MQPLIFLQQGDKAWIKRVGGAVSVISKLNGNLIVNIKDSRVAINEEMAKRIMV